MLHRIIKKVRYILRNIQRKRNSKPVKYPCRKCVYYGACGDGGRTKPCEDRRTKYDVKEADIMRY